MSSVLLKIAPKIAPRKWQVLLNEKERKVLSIKWKSGCSGIPVCPIRLTDYQMPNVGRKIRNFDSFLFISLASVFSYEHGHDFVFTVDLIKEAIRTDLVPPSWRVPI